MEIWEARWGGGSGEVEGNHRNFKETDESYISAKKAKRSDARS
jgi:hypothetical protein